MINQQTGMFGFPIVFLSGIIGFFSCKSPIDIAKREIVSHPDSSMDAWFMSGFIQDNNARIYSTACFFYTLSKPSIEREEGLISVNISLTDIEQGNYLFKIFNIPYKTEMLKISPENIEVNTHNNTKELQAKINNKNCFLKTEFKDYSMKTSCIPSQPLSEIRFHDLSQNVDGSSLFYFCDDAAIRFNSGDAIIKGNGELFFNYFRNQKSLLKYYREVSLMNICIDSTEEYFTILLSNVSFSGYDSITVLSAYGTKKQISQSGIVLTPMEYWSGPITGKRYCVKWKVDISMGTTFILHSTLENQEVVWKKAGFWMGSFWVTSGTDSNKNIGKATAICIK